MFSYLWAEIAISVVFSYLCEYLAISAHIACILPHIGHAQRFLLSLLFWFAFALLQPLRLSLRVRFALAVNIRHEAAIPKLF